MHPALGWEESEAGSRDKLLREASILPLLWRGKKNERTDDHLWLKGRVYNPLQKDVFLNERENPSENLPLAAPLCSRVHKGRGMSATLGDPRSGRRTGHSRRLPPDPATLLPLNHLAKVQLPSSPRSSPPLSEQAQPAGPALFKQQEKPTSRQSGKSVGSGQSPSLSLKQPLSVSRAQVLTVHPNF